MSPITRLCRFSVCAAALMFSATSGNAVADWHELDIVYTQTITAIVTPDEFQSWADGVRVQTVGEFTASADGSRIAFIVAFYTGGAGGDPHLYVANGDGSGLTDLTGSIHADADSTPRHLRLNDDGSRLFFLANDDDHDGTTCFYFDLATGVCHVACHGMDGLGYKKDYVLNAAGTRVYFRYDGGSDINERGLYYSNVPGDPAPYMPLSAVTDVNDVYRIDLVGGAPDAGKLLFVFGGWGTGGGSLSDPRTMWVANSDGTATQTPAEEHSYIWDKDPFEYRLMSQDGQYALYYTKDWIDGGDTLHGLHVIDTESGAKHTIDEGATYDPAMLSPDGELLLVRGGQYSMALVDWQAGTARDTYFPGIGISYSNVSNLTYDAKHYFIAGRTDPEQVPKDAFIYRVDLVDPDYSMAPKIEKIELSDRGLLLADPVPEYTVRATVSDAQGDATVVWVGQDDLMDGLSQFNGISKGPIRYLSELKDDATDGDALAGDSVYTYDTVRVRDSSDFFDQFTLPYNISYRIIAKDADGNFGLADARLLITDDPADLDAAPADPNDVDPNDADPNDADPNDADPNDADPNDVDPNDADPNDADPNDADPNDADPNSADPNDADPNSAQPDGSADPNGGMAGDFPNAVPSGCPGGACGGGLYAFIPLTIACLFAARLEARRRRKH